MLLSQKSIRACMMRLLPAVGLYAVVQIFISGVVSNNALVSALARRQVRKSVQKASLGFTEPHPLPITLGEPEDFHAFGSSRQFNQISSV